MKPRANSRMFQLIDGGGLTSEIRRSIHTQLFRLGHTPREVSSRHHITDAQAVAVAVEVEAADDERRAREAFAAGRRSLLPPPPATAMRRAA